MDPLGLEAKPFAVTDNETGVDSRVARELRNLILDETIELPHTEQSARENAHDWDEESLIEYGKWLCLLLDISADEGDKPLSVIQINRAAKLGLGPSRDRMQRVLGNGITELQEGLGFRARDRYKHWTHRQCVDEGIALASRLGRRPGTKQFEKGHRDGEFLNPKQVIARFGSIRNFQELIGRPSVRGWSQDDHIEWGAAVIRQNGVDTKITSTVLRELSLQGKGPRPKALSKHFSSMSDFNEQARNEYWMQIDLEDQDKEFWRDEAKMILEKCEMLSNAVAQLEEDELLKVVAASSLATELVPELETQRMITAALRGPDYIAKWIVRNGQNDVTMAQLESTALMTRVFNILWPIYRFQNVDLKITVK